MMSNLSVCCYCWTFHIFFYKIIIFIAITMESLITLIQKYTKRWSSYSVLWYFNLDTSLLILLSDWFKEAGSLLKGSFRLGYGNLMNLYQPKITITLLSVLDDQCQNKSSRTNKLIFVRLPFRNKSR